MTKDEEDSLVGRVAMLETLTAHMLAQLMLQFDQPVPLAARILDGVETNLLSAQQVAPEAGRRSAEVALASYRRLSRSILAMVTRIAEPGGNG